MAASKTPSVDRTRVVAALNRIMELELAGVVRYLHYSLMVFGHARIPITKWLREQATEGLAHAAVAGEWVTTLDGHPSLGIGPLLETHRHDVDQILAESLAHEREGVDAYYALLDLVQDRHVALEEYARGMIASEEAHVADIAKMLRRPGSLGSLGSRAPAKAPKRRG